MAWGDVGVDAGQRAEPLSRPQLRFRATGDVRRLEAVLRRLFEEQPALDERAAKLERRLPPGDSRDLEKREALQSERRLQIVDMNLPPVLRPSGFEQHEARRESAELDFIGVRQHRHAVDRVGGKGEPHEVRRRIGKRRGSKLDSGLIGTAPIDALAARHFDDAGNQMDGGPESLARRQSLRLRVVDGRGRGERSGSRQRRRRHHLDVLGDGGNWKIEVDSSDAPGYNHRGLFDQLESVEGPAHAVAGRRQIGDAEMARLVGRQRGDFFVRDVAQDADEYARQLHRAVLRRNRPLNRTGLLGRRLARQPKTHRTPQLPTRPRRERRGTTNVG